MCLWAPSQACPVSSAWRQAEKIATTDSGGYVDEVRRGQPWAAPTQEAVLMLADTQGPALGGSRATGTGDAVQWKGPRLSGGQPRNCWGPLQPWVGSQGMSRVGGGTIRHWVAPTIQATESEQWQETGQRQEVGLDHLRRHFRSTVHLGKFQVFAFFFGRFTCLLLLVFSRNFL